MGKNDGYTKQESAGMWLPETKDEELKGEVIEVSTDGLYGVQLVIKKDDDTTIMTPSHKVLQCRINKVKKNDFIKIVYLGEELPKVKGQNPTKMYDVYIKGLGAEQEEVKD